MSPFQTLKAQVMGKALTSVQGIKDPYGVQCVVLFWYYCNLIWPKVSIRVSGYTGNAKDIFRTVSPKYWVKIVNDHGNPNQLPKPGDVMVFGATPAKGFTNKTVNPDGHVGICDGATPQGYWLIQQNAPRASQPVNRTWYLWGFRPCIGWIRPNIPANNPVHPVFYIVRAGDTLSKIASGAKTTVSALASLNRIKNVNLIRIGQKLRIK